MFHDSGNTFSVLGELGKISNKCKFLALEFYPFFNSPKYLAILKHFIKHFHEIHICLYSRSTNTKYSSYCTEFTKNVPENKITTVFTHT